MRGNGNENTSHIYGGFAREVRAGRLSSTQQKRTAFAVLFAVLVETTSHSPRMTGFTKQRIVSEEEAFSPFVTFSGESVLQIMNVPFYWMRRQAAELARTRYMARFMRWN